MSLSCHRSRIAALAAAILLTLALPFAAFAQETVPDAPEGAMDVQIWPGAEPGRNVTVVSVELPADTVLPTTVRLPIPPGSQVVWAGEILGGPAADDPVREFEVVNGTGGTAAEFTIEQSNLAQIEVVGEALVQDGQNVSLTTQWVQSVPASVTSLSARLPAGSTQVSIDPAPVGQPETNPQGEQLYPLPATTYEPGQQVPITISWTQVPTAGQSTPQGGGANTLPLILGLLAAAIVLLIVVLFWQRGRVIGAGEAPDEPRARRESAFSVQQDAKDAAPEPEDSDEDDDTGDGTVADASETDDPDGEARDSGSQDEAFTLDD